MKKMISMRFTALAFVAFLLVGCGPSVQVVPVTMAPVRPDTARVAEKPKPAEQDNPYEGIETGRFDGGKMWTFDYPPIAYFQEEYGLTPDSAWLARARAGALRFGGNCSASFVSGQGLVMTNHHCAREHISDVEKEGEDLLDDGFLARDRAAERKVEDLHVAKLEIIRDVTEEIYSLDRSDLPPGARASARMEQAEALAKRLTSEAKDRDTTLFVEVVPLHSGAQFAAYTYRRYSDVRLVMAPEIRIGFFGGEWDNFTYPRYNLDVSFFRAYDPSGKPVIPEHHFRWSTSGSTDGEVVFVVGNGGSTSRLSTVSQLEYLRDQELPLTVALLEARAGAYEDYMRANPDEAEEHDLANALFSLKNTQKSFEGQLDGLRSDWLIPRRGAAEYRLREEIAASDSLEGLYGGVFDGIAAVQLSKKASLGTAQAFAFFLHPSFGSRILARAMYGYVYALISRRGAPPAQRSDIRRQALEIESFPPGLEKELIALRLAELEDALGPQDPSVRRLLSGRTPMEVASQLVDSTALGDSAAYRVMLDENFLASNDPSVDVIEVLGPLYFTQNQQLESFEEREQGLNARLGRARFAVYGRSIPPDATFSLRLSDGRVAGYKIPSMPVPPFTTYYGLYERFYAAGDRQDWLLPESWVQPPESLDLSTPLNLVSTNDITGGNSGSPLLNANLEVVGLIFDSNMEALPNKFLYTDDRARSVSVDARGILEALREIYRAEHLVQEILAGAAQETERPE